MVKNTILNFNHYLDIDNSKNPELEVRKIQIIISTHDPLTLSDIPNYNIVYIDRIKNEKSDIVHISEGDSKPKQSFGANVHDLLANSFFLEDGLMGDFAKDKIEKTIEWLGKKLKSIQENTDANLDEVQSVKQYHLAIINIIDEPLLKHKLEEMYYDAFPDDID